MAYFGRSDPLSVSQPIAGKASRKTGCNALKRKAKRREGEQPVAQPVSRAPVTLPKLMFLERAKNEV